MRLDSPEGKASRTCPKLWTIPGQLLYPSLFQLFRLLCERPPQLCVVSLKKTHSEDMRLFVAPMARSKKDV